VGFVCTPPQVLAVNIGNSSVIYYGYVPDVLKKNGFSEMICFIIGHTFLHKPYIHFLRYTGKYSTGARELKTANYSVSVGKHTLTL
jgi:hypothetical protein